MCVHGNHARSQAHEYSQPPHLPDSIITAAKLSHQLRLSPVMVVKLRVTPIRISHDKTTRDGTGPDEWAGQRMSSNVQLSSVQSAFPLQSLPYDKTRRRVPLCSSRRRHIAGA